jgi:DNA-binding Lrp family transcriptional regulator
MPSRILRDLCGEIGTPAFAREITRTRSPTAKPLTRSVKQPRSVSGRSQLEAGAAMKTIFVMVKCELGKSYVVADEAVETIEQVSEVYSISGQYDLLMKFYLADDADIGHFVTEKVQTLAGVRDTFTIVAYKAFSEDKSA